VKPAAEALRSIGPETGISISSKTNLVGDKGARIDKPLTSGNVKSRTHLEE
jgi:hypothetical protein